jgi:hypothetical protein
MKNDSSDVVKIGLVSSEGGPFLIGDHGAIVSWLGSEQGGHDYQRACKFFDETQRKGGEIVVGQRSCLLWEPDGAGTAEVFRVGGDLVLLKTWRDEEGDGDLVDLVKSSSEPETFIGRIEADTGKLVILWAPEDGSALTSGGFDENGRPRHGYSSSEASLLVAVPTGRYDCFHTTIDRDSIFAMRCRLTLVEAADTKLRGG